MIFIINIDFYSPWESLHGCLLGLKAIITHSSQDSDERLLSIVREAVFKLLTNPEVRVRLAAGMFFI